MKHEFLEWFQHIDTLIQEHKTGTPADLAQTEGVLKRTIYKYVRVMKNLGAPIAFNAMTKTYYYTIEGSFVGALSFSGKNDYSKEGQSLSSKILVTEQH